MRRRTQRQAFCQLLSDKERKDDSVYQIFLAINLELDLAAHKGVKPDSEECLSMLSRAFDEELDDVVQHGIDM